MYSEKKVQENICLAQSSLCACTHPLDSHASGPCNFSPCSCPAFSPITLEYHSTAECDRFEQYLRDNSMYILDEHGAPTGMQNLTEFARRWMQNEQALSLCDAAYFLTRYCKVKDQQNVIRRFNFRVAQRILFDIICELELDDAAIEILILKARQLGMSTLVELLMVHRIALGYGINAVIGSADESMTHRMGDIFRFAYDNLPIWLCPQTTRRVESAKGLLEFGTLSTSVSFQHGAQKHGIGTGTTPTLYHLSEVALYEAIGGRDKVVALIEEGLWKAVHASPNVFGVLETTGRGDKGWLPETWRYSKQHWPQRKSRMCPLFLPWFCGVDLYPTETWIRTRPVPASWRPNPDTIQHVAKCELYVQSEPLLRRHLLAEQQRGTIPWNLPHPSGEWHMPREQQWFWECGHEEAKAKGTQGSWYQEMAADDVEALQRSGGEPVFGHDTIADIERRRQCEYIYYGLSGQSIESVHEPLPEYIDYSPTTQRIPVRYRSPRGETYKWELVPILYAPDEASQESPQGLLIVWEPPAPSVTYSIGVDTSQGKGQDSTAISVWALGWDSRPDRQVAEFASPFVSHTEAFSFVLCIAAYYGQHMRLGETKWKEPYVAIEQVAAVGDTCQAQMVRMGYSNFHRAIRYDSRSLGKAKRMSRKLGWYTYGWSRPILLGHFVHWAKNGWADVNSPWLLYEMKHFEITTTASGKEKMEHEDEEHDDRIFAAAMAIFCPHDMDRMDQRTKKRPSEDALEREIDIGEYGVVPVDVNNPRGSGSGEGQVGTIISATALREKSVLSLEDVLYQSRRPR